MALQLRRGTNGQRLTITPAEGELVYATDTKLVYIGDGTTAGGTLVGGAGGGSNGFATIAVATQSSVVAEQSLDTLTLATGTGLSITTDANSDTITFTNSGVTSAVAGTGINVSSATGAVTISSNALLNLSEDTNPQLGGNLDVNGFTITSSSNNNVSIIPNGTGLVLFQNSLEINEFGNIRKTGEFNISSTIFTSFGSNSDLIDGNVYITRNSYSSTTTAGFVFAQHHETADAVNFNFYRTRGTGDSPVIANLGDDLGDISFITWDGVQRFPAANISVKIDGAISSGKVPGKIEFFVHDGTTTGIGGIRLRAEIKPDGRFRIDTLAGLSTNNITMPTNNSITVGDVRLNQNGLSTVNSNANLFITANSAGRIYLDNMAWPASDGTNGQVLTTNGSGSLSWSSPAGLGNLTVTNSTITSTDSTVTITPNLVVTGNLSTSSTIGYQSGTGGTVTQLTNKTTGVTLDKPCGTITMANETINSGSEVSFTVTNSFIDDTDVVLIAIKSGGTAGAYLAQCDQVSNGSFRITITNISNSSLDEILVLNFIIVKSVSA